MAGDLIRETRRAALTHLKDWQPLTDLVAPASIHPSQTPALVEWPFVRWDAPQSIPFDLSCVEGATITFLLHGFAKDRLEGKLAVETAEDHASRLGTALKTGLHQRRLPVADTTALFRVRSVRLLRDGDEAGAYHVVLSCEARILAS